MLHVANVYAPSRKELEQERLLVNDPYWQAERETLSDLLGRLAAAVSDSDYFSLQVTLVARLKARQQRISELRDLRDRIGERLAGLVAMTPKPVGEVRATQAELDETRWAERVQRCLHWLLLDVGDALVWRRLGFDRAALTALGQGQRVAWLSDGAGWDAEAAAVGELWDEAVLAIINDATTCLRLGDLTCFFDDRVEIREVKAGRVVSESEPQQVRLREAVTLINEHRALIDGHPRALVRSAEPLASFLPLLDKAVSKARRVGRAVLRVSRAQLVVVRDFGHRDQLPFEEADARKAAGWPRSDVIVDWGTSLRRMRDRHYNFADLAPLALLPLPLDDRVDLLLGQLDYSVWVNVTSMAAFLRGRGFYAEPIAHPDSSAWFLIAGRRHGKSMHTVHVSAHIREMMAIELVTPTAVSKLIETLLDGVQKDARLFDEQTAVVPGDERGVWEPTC